ncbi:MAG: T9SS type A sorting domain-containing protein [Bacteroidota bacterium]
MTATYVYTLFIHDSYLLLGTDSGAFVSSNGGSIWEKLGMGIPKKNVYAFASHKRLLYAGAETGLYTSDDNGLSWDSIKASSFPLDRVVTLLATGNNLLAGTGEQGLFLSTDFGTSWNAVNLVEGYVFVRRLSSTGGKVFVAASWMSPSVGSYAGVFVSTDDGISWSQVQVGGSVEGGFTIFDFVSSGTDLIEAVSISALGDRSRYGVFKWSGSFKTWKNLSAGLQDSMVFRIAILGDALFAGTFNSGVWRRPLSELVTEVDRSSSGVPFEYMLEQNYPNPFNATTTLRLHLSTIKHVSLKIFDLLGREVATLVDHEMTPGAHEVQWDGSMQTSGLYICTLQSGTSFETRMMILLK